MCNEQRQRAAKKSQQAARGQIQTSQCQVRESVETKRPQGTHAMRSGPQEVNKGVNGQQAGGQQAEGQRRRQEANSTDPGVEVKH